MSRPWSCDGPLYPRDSTQYQTVGVHSPSNDHDTTAVDTNASALVSAVLVKRSGDICSDPDDVSEVGVMRFVEGRRRQAQRRRHVYMYQSGRLCDFDSNILPVVLHLSSIFLQPL